MPVDFNYFLNRKYALLQQQADAGSRNAATNAVAGAAAANLDQTRARLLPKETEANIGLTQANTGLARSNAGLTDAQASVVVPVAQANIRNTNAQASFTGTQDAVLRREGLTERAPSPASLQRILGQRLPGIGDVAGFRLSGGPAVDERRRPGESEVQWLDRINGL